MTENPSRLQIAVMALPHAFRAMVRSVAYDRGHHAGEDEVDAIAEGMVADLLPCIAAYTKDLEVVPNDAVVAFLASKERNAWIDSPGINVYVRRAFRMVDGVLVATFDISAIEVMGERNKGAFKRWYAGAVAACREAGVEYVYIESIMSSVLEGWCVRNGFILNGGCDVAPSYIKKI